MVRRTLIGRLLKSWTNEISLSVIGRPVYIFLLREREARRQKKTKQIIKSSLELCYSSQCKHALSKHDQHLKSPVYYPFKCQLNANFVFSPLSFIYF